MDLPNEEGLAKRESAGEENASKQSLTDDADDALAMLDEFDAMIEMFTYSTDYEDVEYNFEIEDSTKDPENPWKDVYGPGDEAETAYWNTD